MAATPMVTATNPDPSRTTSGDALAGVGNRGAGACVLLAPLLVNARDALSAWALDTNASPHADTASPIQSAFLSITSVPS